MAGAISSTASAASAAGTAVRSGDDGPKAITLDASGPPRATAASRNAPYARGDRTLAAAESTKTIARTRRASSCAQYHTADTMPPFAPDTVEGAWGRIAVAPTRCRVDAVPYYRVNVSAAVQGQVADV